MHYISRVSDFSGALLLCEKRNLQIKLYCVIIKNSPIENGRRSKGEQL